MLIRRISVFTVLMLTLMLGITGMTDAHDPEPDKPLDGAKTFMESKEGDVEEEIRKLDKMKDAMNVLIGKWSENKSKISSGIELTLVGALGTTASVAANIFSGGMLTATTKTAGLFTLKKAIDVGMSISAHSGYVEAMNSAINAVDSQLGNVEAAIGLVNAVYDLNPAVNMNGNVPYNAAYNRYIKTAAINLGRNDPATIDYTINTYDIDYDQLEHVGRSGKHTIAERTGFTYANLPYNYKCENRPCDVMFRSPHQAFFSHRKKCGTGENLDDVESRSLTYADYADDYVSRKVADGCGRHYYHCPSDPDTDHEPQTCSTSGCSVKYRNCLSHTKPHSNHSTTPDSTTTETTENQYVAPEPTPPPTPSYHPCGVHQTSVSGTHSAAGCGVSGHYVCDGSDHSLQASCTSTNGWSNSCTVTSFYACQSHTHVYPPDRRTCANGHSYKTYVQWQVDYHRTKTCRWCGGTWEDCGTGRSYCPVWTRSSVRCSE